MCRIYSKKCAIQTSDIVFFGSVYGKDGIRPDPSKIEDIRQMPTPQDEEDVQRGIGLMNYLVAYTACHRQCVTVARTSQDGRPIHVARRSPAYLGRSEEMYRQRIMSVVLPST